MGIQKSVKDSILCAGAVSLHLTQYTYSGAGGVFPSSSVDCSTFRNSVYYTKT